MKFFLAGGPFKPDFGLSGALWIKRRETPCFKDLKACARLWG
jgi:hypothetical protein